MLEHKAESFSIFSRISGGRRRSASSGLSARASTPAADRLLLESAPTQARSLEGRPLTMDSSLMLPDRSRLRLLNRGHGSPPHSRTEATDARRPEVKSESARREAEADARAFEEGGRGMDFEMFVPSALATKGQPRIALSASGI
jgi:hypothetical protein